MKYQVFFFGIIAILTLAKSPLFSPIAFHQGWSQEGDGFETLDSEDDFEASDDDDFEASGDDDFEASGDDGFEASGDDGFEASGDDNSDDDGSFKASDDNFEALDDTAGGEAAERVESEESSNTFGL